MTTPNSSIPDPWESEPSESSQPREDSDQAPPSSESSSNADEYGLEELETLLSQSSDTPAETPAAASDSTEVLAELETLFSPETGSPDPAMSQALDDFGLGDILHGSESPTSSREETPEAESMVPPPSEDMEAEPSPEVSPPPTDTPQTPIGQTTLQPTPQTPAQPLASETVIQPSEADIVPPVTGETSIQSPEIEPPPTPQDAAPIGETTIQPSPEPPSPPSSETPIQQPPQETITPVGETTIQPPEEEVEAIPSPEVSPPPMTPQTPIGQTTLQPTPQQPVQPLTSETGIQPPDEGTIPPIAGETSIQSPEIEPTPTPQETAPATGETTIQPSPEPPSPPSSETTIQQPPQDTIAPVSETTIQPPGEENIPPTRGETPLQPSEEETVQASVEAEESEIPSLGGIAAAGLGAGSIPRSEGSIPPATEDVRPAPEPEPVLESMPEPEPAPVIPTGGADAATSTPLSSPQPTGANATTPTYRRILNSRAKIVGFLFILASIGGILGWGWSQGFLNNPFNNEPSNQPAAGGGDIIADNPDAENGGSNNQPAVSGTDSNETDSNESESNDESGERLPLPTGIATGTADTVTTETNTETNTETRNDEETGAGDNNAPPKLDVSDVPRDHWGYDYVAAMDKAGILPNFPDGRFQPDKLVTRAELAASLQRAFGIESEGPITQFNDVPADFWAQEAISGAIDAGFMRGYSDDIFRPDENIPRYQVLVTLVSGLKLDRPEDAASILNEYSDASELPDWAVEQLAASENAELIAIAPEDRGSLKPNRPATRAEANAMIYKALVKSGKIKGPLNP